MARFATEKKSVFTRQPTEETEQISDLPPRMRGARDIYGIKKQYALGHGAG